MYVTYCCVTKTCAAFFATQEPPPHPLHPHPYPFNTFFNLPTSRPLVNDSKFLMTVLADMNSSPPIASGIRCLRIFNVFGRTISGTTYRYRMIRDIGMRWERWETW